MSAFIVSDNTMDRALAAIVMSGAWDAGKIDTPEQLTALGVSLFDVNDDAVSQRYNQPRETEPMPYKYKARAYGKVEALKGLQCLIYQCSEGNVPESPIYKALRNAELALLQDIVRAMPAYNAAPWD